MQRELIIFSVLVALVQFSARAEDEKGKKAEDDLEKEWTLQEDADYPDLVAADEESALMDEFALLQEEDIVLTAAKHKQKAGFSPSAVVVITRRDIEESGALTFCELMRRYPATHFYIFDPLYPAAEIRGTILVLLMIDGREINIELFPAPFYATMPIGLRDIERIEVVLGPNSALYGANAVSAVINIVTRKPTPDLKADIYLAAGEHGTSILEGFVGGGIGPVSAQASFGIDRANSWMDRGFRAKDTQRAYLSLRYDLPDGHITANGGMARGSGRIYATTGYMDFHSFLFPHAKLDFELGDFKARAYWYGTIVDFTMDMGLVHPETGVVLGTIPTFHFNGDVYHTDAQYDLQLFESNLLITGADFRLTHFHSDQLLDPDILEYRFGVFLHDEQRLGDRVLLTAGLRFDWNSKTEPAVSPRLAAVYNPTGEHFLRASWGMAFRKPSLMETSTNFRVDTDFPTVKTLFEDPEFGLSNAALDNEILNMVELGYRGALFEKKLRLGADVYFGMNRKWISFSTDVHFRPPPLQMQIDLQNTDLGYKNTGADRNILGFTFFVEGEPQKALTLFLRGELRYHYLISDDAHFEKTAWYVAATGGTLRLPFGLVAHLVLCSASERNDDVRHPVSIMEPTIWIDVPATLYLLGAVTYRVHIGPARVDLGLNLFNPFGGRFHEKAGVSTPNGSNYGGEFIGTRLMATARFRY